VQANCVTELHEWWHALVQRVTGAVGSEFHDWGTEQLDETEQRSGDQSKHTNETDISGRIVSRHVCRAY
jgi:hypothetical protein